MDYNIEICKVAHFSSYVSVSFKPVYGLLFPWGKRTSIACFLLLLAAGRRAPRRGVQFRLAFNLMISDCKKGALKQERHSAEGEILHLKLLLPLIFDLESPFTSVIELNIQLWKCINMGFSCYEIRFEFQRGLEKSKRTTTS